MPQHTIVRVTVEKRTTSAKKIYYYLICTRSRSGKRQRKVIATGTTHRAVAIKRQKRLELDIADGFDPWKPVVKAQSLMDGYLDFLRDAKARGLRHATVDTYRGVLKQFVSHLGEAVLLDEIETSDVRSFCVQPHLAPSSRHHRLRHVKTFLGWAVENDLIDDNPANLANLPRPKKEIPRFITGSDFKAILQKLDYLLEKPGSIPKMERAAYWLKPLVTTTYYLGLRRGEVIRLRWDAVDLNEGTIQIRRSKGGDRFLPMPSPLIKMLKSWKNQSKQDQLVFTSKKGTALNPNYVSRSFRRVCQIAEISTGSFHALRHGTATAILSAGGSTREVQAILGHSSVQVTEKYLHIVDGQLRRLLDQTFGETESSED